MSVRTASHFLLCVFGVSQRCESHKRGQHTHTHTLLLKAFMLLHLVFFYTKSDLRQKFRPRLPSHLNTPDQSMRGLICPNCLFQRVPNCVFQTPHPDQLGSFRHCGLCCALLVAVSECLKGPFLSGACMCSLSCRL